jgi:tol-pal system protein YbgF
MMVSPSRFLAICLSCLLPLYAVAEAPVVDDSENFAILDEQQAAFERPVAKAPIEDMDNDDEVALAQDHESRPEVNDYSNNENAELLNKIKGLQQEVQELRGQLDVQAHELNVLKQQQLSFYKDFDARLRNAPTSPSKTEAPIDLSLDQNTTTAPEKAKATPAPQPAVTSTPAPTQARNNPADEQISYLAAYDLVKTKRFDDALVAMQDFTTRYPKGGYTANAQYWLGELYMVKKDYPQAIKHFEIVLKHFSSSSKAAACSLKIGYALAASGQEAEAKRRLQQVIKNFPDTPTAQLASTKLNSLNAS